MRLARGILAVSFAIGGLTAGERGMPQRASVPLPPVAETPPPRPVLQGTCFHNSAPHTPQDFDNVRDYTHEMDKNGAVIGITIEMVDGRIERKGADVSCSFMPAEKAPPPSRKSNTPFMRPGAAVPV